MSTINYNEMKLEEVTAPQIFDPPKRMLVWDNSANIGTSIVAAILPDVGFPVVTIDEDGVIQSFHLHCAEIPEAPKLRKATWLEVARWCATGNGLVYDTDRDRIDTGIMFKPNLESEPIVDEIKVRRWEDTEWHDPDVFYMGIEKEST